jgi:hypothetical protein
MYLTTEAAAAGLRGNAQFEIVTPTPTVRLVAAYAPAASAGRRIDTEGVSKALASAGWAKQGGRDEGLPSTGVLLALLEVGT